ncbi:hypothetical protein GCM10011416_01390 [Polaribacter pacificus]|uniref:Uncharacterized protein n=1 Tax=Polaribacter pacificus TaxID=1775173 RepID=A0A917HSA0_9FLAO|nr:hypothetical protein [Polaribacter pacificus]GGG88781.1 hypothetical protein GCM10011416_01390 [Polaribacter pacificus]
MKKYIHKKAVFAAVTILGIIGCTEFTEKIEDFNIGVTNAIFEQTATLELTDVHGNQQDIIDTDFTVVFSGADADKLVSEAGEFAITENDGFIQLSVNPNKSVGVKELNFDVTVSGGSYKTATYAVKIADTISKVTLPMLNEAKTLGLERKSNSTSLTNDATTSIVTMETSKEKSLTSTKISIPVGTKFMDANGAAVTGSNLTTNIKNIGPFGLVLDTEIDLEHMEVFDQNSNKITNKTLSLIGYTTIDISLDGKKITKSTTPVTVSIGVENNIYNLETGATFKIGDSYPIYKNDQTTNNWTFYQNGTVVKDNTNGMLRIEFTTTEMVRFGAGALTAKTANKSLANDCTSSNQTKDDQTFLRGGFGGSSVIAPGGNGTVTFGGVFSPSAQVTFTLTGESVSSATLAKTQNDGINPQVTQFLQRVTQFLQTLNITEFKDAVQLQVTKHVGSSTVSEDVEKEDICAGVDAVNAAAASIPDIKIDVSANCNDKTLVPDGIVLYVEKDDQTFKNVGTIKNGKLTLKGFELNKEYTFKIMYQGQSYVNKWTFDSATFKIENFNIPASVCNKLGF